VNERGRNLDQEFGFVYFRWFGKALKEGLFNRHPFEVVPGGLHGIEKGQKDLKVGKNKATKYIFKISEAAQS
jgi:NADPH:quinone reductase